ncbi:MULTISPECIES: hypothetical protein [unclassified Actinotalea]|uniref:SCO4402 family protein n=1 Tax=unclassified Actinotalea TaxID=2638618 RepID=UPI0015F56522|nr:MULTISPECIES: hypothetical protein [unclassified Actinotalea]
MRLEGLAALRALADGDTQDARWVQGEPMPNGFRDSLAFRLDQLFEMSMLLPHPEAMVGVTVFADEVAVLGHLGACLQAVLDETDEAEPSEVLGHGVWPDVVKAAGDAVDRLVRNGGFPDEP